MLILCKISQFLYSAFISGKAFYIHLAWNCLFTPHFGEFWGILPQMNSDIVATQKRTFRGRKRVVWAINLWKSVHGFDLGACPRKKYSITNRKKSQKRNTSPIWGEAPAERIEMKICVSVDLVDLIMYVKFKFEKFQGFWCHLGSNFPFPIDFARGPYHSAALRCCLWKRFGDIRPILEWSVEKLHKTESANWY